MNEPEVPFTSPPEIRKIFHKMIDDLIDQADKNNYQAQDLLMSMAEISATILSSPIIQDLDSVSLPNLDDPNAPLCDECGHNHD